MAAKNSVRVIPVSFFNTAGLTNIPQALNPGGLPEACFLVRFSNSSDADVIISVQDVTVAHEVILAGNTVSLPGHGNSMPGQLLPMFPQGTIFYMVGVPGQVGGLIYLSGYYQDMV